MSRQHRVSETWRYISGKSSLRKSDRFQNRYLSPVSLWAQGDSGTGALALRIRPASCTGFAANCLGQSLPSLALGPFTCKMKLAHVLALKPCAYLFRVSEEVKAEACGNGACVKPAPHPSGGGRKSIPVSRRRSPFSSPLLC